MKNKLEMAHEWAIELLRSGYHRDDIISCAWQYAEAMQAEADKRGTRCDEKIEINTYPEWDASINYPPDAWVVYRGEKRLAVSIKNEWQPDWSQAPSDALTWAINGKGDATWALYENGEFYSCVEAPSFNYQGDWRDSLRKRPN